jgi:integrase
VVDEKHTQVRGIIEENGNMLASIPANDLAAVPEQLEPEAARAAEYALEARSERTRRAYKADWQGFTVWCAKREMRVQDAKPAAVAAYLASLADNGYTAATITRAATGISCHMRAIDPENWPRGGQPEAVKLTMMGIRRELGVAPKFRKASATLDLVRKMLPHLGTGLEGRRNRAIVLTGFWCAMRRSEVAAIEVRDVTLSNEGMIVITRRSKTDPEAEGFERGARHTTSAAICAPCEVVRWLQESGVTGGPLFRAIQGGEVLSAPIPPELVSELVQQGARGLGMRPSRFGAHSLRAGFVTTAAERGKPLDAIMRQTGHRSVKQVMEYIRHATVFEGNATEDLE